MQKSIALALIFFTTALAARAQFTLDADALNIDRNPGETWWFDIDNSGNPITVSNINAIATPDGPLPGWAWTQSGFLVASNSVITEIVAPDSTTNFAAAAAGDIVDQSVVTTNTADKTIGSLISRADFQINGGATLSLDQGGLLFDGASHQVRSTAGGGFLTSAFDNGAGANELFIIAGSTGTGGSQNSHTVSGVVIRDSDQPVSVITDGNNPLLTGQMHLAAANTYSGGTIINRIRVRASNLRAYGTGTVTVNGDQGQAWLTAGGGSFANDFVIDGQGWLDNGLQLGAIRMGSGTAISGNITLSDDARISPWSGGTIRRISGDITGPHTLEVFGNDRLIHTGSQLAVTNVFLSRGSLQLGEPGSPVNYTPAPDITTAANTTLDAFGAILGDVDANGRVSVGTRGDLSRLELRNLSLNDGSSLHIDLIDGLHDVLVCSNLVQTGTVTLVVQVLGDLPNGSYTVIEYDPLSIPPPNFILSGNTTRKTMLIDTAIPGTVNLVVAGLDDTLIWAPQDPANLWDVDVTTNWTVNTTQTTFLVGDKVLFDDSGANTNVVNLTQDLEPRNISVNSSSNYTFAGAGRLTGSSALLKAGTGSLQIDNNNSTWNGEITVTNGVLRANNNNALGNKSAGSTVTDTGTLDVSGRDLGTEPIFISGEGFNGQGAIVNTGANQINATHQVTLIGDATVGGTARWDIRGGAADTFLSTGGNPYNLTKVGPAQFSLVGAVVDPALNDIFVNQGRFSYETTSSGLGDPAARMVVSSTGEFFMWAIATPADKQFFFADNALLTAGSGQNTVVGPVTLVDGTVRFNAGAALTVASSITGAGGISKIGGNDLFLTGTNDYAGTTTVNQGTVWVGRNTTTGTLGTGPVVLNGGNLRVDRSDPTSILNPITGNGSIVLYGTNVVELGVVTLTNAAANTINIGQNATATPTLLVTSNSTITASRVFSGQQNGFAGDILQTGGTMTVTDTTDGEGPLRIGHYPNEISTYDLNGGELFIPNGRISLGIDGHGIWNIDGGTATVNRVEINGRNNTGNGTLNLMGGVLAVGAGGIVNEGNPYSMTFSGGSLEATTNAVIAVNMTLTNFTPVVNTREHTLEITGTISGNGDLAKEGSGTLIYTGDQGYDGTTSVNKGTLQVDGTHTTALHVVNNGATLSGTGTMESDVQISGGTLSPGPGIGALQVTGVMNMGASSYQVDVNGAAIDQVNGIDALELSANNTLTVNGTLTEIRYVVMTYNTRTGEFQDTSAVSAQGYRVVYNDVAGEVVLQQVLNIPVDIVRTGDNVEVSWLAETGVTYEVEFSTNLVTGPWFDLVQEVIPTQTGLLTITNIPVFDREYYRVGQK